MLTLGFDTPEMPAGATKHSPEAFGEKYDIILPPMHVAARRFQAVARRD